MASYLSFELYAEPEADFETVVILELRGSNFPLGTLITAEEIP